MHDEDLQAIPFFLVVGRETANRRAVDRALRAMVPGLTVETVAGNSIALDRAFEAIIAQDVAEFVVVDMPAQADPEAFFEIASPYVEMDELALAAMIAVVDVARFWNDYAQGSPEVAQMLVGIVESATIVVLANADVADDAESVEGYLSALNPLATMLRLERLQQMALDELVTSALTRYGEMAVQRGLGEKPTWDTGMGGFQTFTWTTQSRLDRDRFLALIGEERHASVFRVRGSVQFAGEVTAEISVIGDAVMVEEFTDDEARAAYAEVDESMREAFEEEGISWDEEGEGMAMIEDGTLLSFVGRNMPISDLTALMEGCTLPE